MVKLDSLPVEVYKRIPLSIKTYKNEYELEELPYDIQNLIESYFNKKELIYTNKVYDFTPTISEYGDFGTITNLRALIIEYMINYLRTLVGEYPFNGSVGSNVKRLLQKKDTTIQRLFMTEELNNMIRSFGPNIDQKISVSNFNITKSSNNISLEYNLYIDLKIDDISTQINTNIIL